MPKPIKNLGIFSLGIIVFIVDRIIKNIFYNQQLITKNGWLAYTQNYGIAFGLHLPKAFLITLNIFLLLWLTGWLIKVWSDKNSPLAGLIFLIMLGGYSNLLDRFKFGFVVDYINLKIWPVFNLADMLIVVGIIILIFQKTYPSKNNLTEK